MNHMTTCPRTSRMQATSHIPRLTEVRRAIVLRDLRDSQGGPATTRRQQHVEDQVDQVHQAHLQRSICSRTGAAAMMPDLEWSYGVHVGTPRSHMSCEIREARFLQPSSSCAAHSKMMSSESVQHLFISTHNRLQTHCPSNGRDQFDPLALHPVRRGSCYLLPHTPCSDACPERELHETCLVLTDDTRLARPELLEEVEGEIVEGRVVTKVETRIARAIGNLWRCVL